MRALDRKLCRDLWSTKGQGLAIAMVFAAGLAVFIMYSSTVHSLRLTQENYYRAYRFADVFARCKRAPQPLAKRIAGIPGVAEIATRVVAGVTLDVPGLAEPATGVLISIPERRVRTLDDLFLRRGRWVEPERGDEVLVSEAFALAHRLEPGNRVKAIVNGRRRQLRIVGIALSPEYVYSIRPGEFIPDDKHFGLFWMGHRALATAFDMEGGFNDVALRLLPGASAAGVIARLDRLLEPYGGLGAYPRALQISHWYLESELRSLQTAALIIPVIFLAVAAFLLNVALTRIITVQREQIAALKALGYSNRDLALHYTGWGLAIALFGTLLGIASGIWLGSSMTEMYNDFFRFPALRYHFELRLAVTALAIGLGAAVVGAFTAVRRAVRLPPAEAMRPQPPATFRLGWLERSGIVGLLAPTSRMILRNLQRRPGRALASIVGIAFAVAILIIGTFFIDAFDEVVFVQFQVAQRQDITVSFTEPASASALYDVRRFPGVVYAEPQRVVPARLRVANRSRQTGIIGLPSRSELYRVIDPALRAVELPSDGLVLSAKLGEILGARRGDLVQIEVLEGARPVRLVPVVDLVKEYMGTSAYMELGTLHRLLREGDSLSGAALQVDGAHLEELYHRLKALPAVAGVNLKRAAYESFQETFDETLGVLILFNVLFAGIIAFGVVYNTARVSLSERSHELASLRVLGFTQREITTILLGELALLVVAALPCGMVLGYGLAWLVVLAYDTELYRFPLVILPRTYAFAAVCVLLAAVVSALAARRRLGRLDLIAVLKTKE